MRFKSQQHKSTFKKAIRKKDKKDTRLMAAMYLLTADQILWNKVKGNIRESRMSKQRQLSIRITTNPPLTQPIERKKGGLAKKHGRKTSGYLFHWTDI